MNLSVFLNLYEYLKFVVSFKKNLSLLENLNINSSISRRDNGQYFYSGSELALCPAPASC